MQSATWLIAVVVCFGSSLQTGHARYVPTDPDNEFLPRGFLGLWRGIPSASILGPWKHNLTMNFARASNGDYLLEQNLNWQSVELVGGWQRFYIEGSGPTAGSLWYCGKLFLFSEMNMETGGNLTAARDLFALKSSNPPGPDATRLEYCLVTGDPTTRSVPQASAPWPLNVDASSRCSGCSCATWVLELLDGGSVLHSKLTMAGSVHIDNTMHRAGPPNPVKVTMPGHGDEFSCELEHGGRDDKPVPGVGPTNELVVNQNDNKEAGSEAQTSPSPSPSTSLPPNHPTQGTGRSASRCPMEHLHRPKTVPHHGIKGTGSYDFCYVLNEATSFRMEWTLDETKGLLHVLVAGQATDDNSWISIGFRPLSYAPVGSDPHQLPAVLGTGVNRVFGMQGADMVIASSRLGVQTYYADQFVGSPKKDDSVTLSDAAVTLSGGHVALSFTRPLVAGHLKSQFNVSASVIDMPADFLWALGQNTPGQDAPGYHGVTRGVRMMNWRKPSTLEDPAMRC